jgi:hypothetical protein
LRIFFSYGGIIIASEELQIFRLYSALKTFEQGGIFIVPHLLWQGRIFIVPHLLCYGASIFPVYSEGLSHLIASYDT